MTDETKETIAAAMTILKTEMQRENCIFGIEIDRKDIIIQNFASWTKIASRAAKSKGSA